MTIKKGIAIVVRQESLEDFKQIAKRVSKIDPSIGVVVYPEQIQSRWIPKEFLNIPVLAVYLVNPPSEDKNLFSSTFAVKQLGKMDEYEHFKKFNIPCLSIARFEWGMHLDKNVYGDWVVIKPENIQSTGKDINMLPIDSVPTLTLENFPEEHLIRKDSYLIQKFIKTGQTPSLRRVLVFLDEILLSYHVELKTAYPKYSDQLKVLLSNSVATNLRGNRNLTLEKNEKINDLAKEVAKTFPENPLLGIDIIQDSETGNLYVLEVNLGGNTWAFTNSPGKNFRDNVGIHNMIQQYMAWDRAAEALVRKAHELAC